MPLTDLVRISADAWLAEATRRHPRSLLDVRFRCPSCGYVQTGHDFLALEGMTRETMEGSLGFSCIGRFIDAPQEAFTGPPGPCNYAGGGLIRIAPIAIEANDEERYFFDFDVEPLTARLATRNS